MDEKPYLGGQGGHCPDLLAKGISRETTGTAHLAPLPGVMQPISAPEFHRRQNNQQLKEHQNDVRL
jgi:hypothetical protein